MTHPASHNGGGEDQDRKIYWSKNQSPEEWPSDIKKYWCPMWIQPAVFPILRWLGFTVIDTNKWRKK